MYDCYNYVMSIVVNYQVCSAYIVLSSVYRVYSVQFVQPTRVWYVSVVLP